MLFQYSETHELCKTKKIKSLFWATMKTIQFTSHISEDGILRLQIPTDMPTQEVEILIVVQPLIAKKKDMPEDSGWPPGFFEKTAGIFRDEPIQPVLK